MVGNTGHYHHTMENSHHLTLAPPVPLLQRQPRPSSKCCWFMSIHEMTHKLSYSNTKELR